MKIVKLEGMFCANRVKTGIRTEIDFTYDGTTYHPPTDLIEQLNKIYGSDDWDRFEVFITELDDGTIYHSYDYGRCDICMQFDNA